MTGVRILPANQEHLPALVELAGVIWRAYYPGIISPEQIEFMLARMYDLAMVREEIRQGRIRYYRLLAGEQFAGFASVGPAGQEDVMKLHKLYLLPELHGRGLGSLLLNHCETDAARRGARRLVLAVNKRNTRAIAAYQRNGYAVIEPVVTDIGGGFVMDDFIMGRVLGNAKG